MATARYRISVRSQTWDENYTVREFVGALKKVLDQTPGKASNLKVETKNPTDKYNKALVGTVTVVQYSAEV